MNETVVLDTSAILCVVRDEPGSDFVEARLDDAAAGRLVAAASFISLTEILYTTSRVAGKRRADELIAVVKAWPLEFVYPDEALAIAAGEIKAQFSLSFADAFVAATARARNALLVHKDPEFETLRSAIRLKPLPCKPAKAPAKR